MAVDFENIKKLDERWRKEKQSEFDVSPDGLWGNTINPEIGNMSAQVIDDMEFWKSRQRGIWLIDGGVGAGKSGFISMVAYKGKYYFGRTPILDYRPTELFGFYIHFNQATFINMLEQLNEVVSGEIKGEFKRIKGGEKPSRLIEQAVKEWYDTEAQAFFQHSTLGIDEVKRYKDKRRPHNPIGLLLSDIDPEWRHFDIQILEATTNVNNLDFRTFQELTHRVNITLLDTCKSLIIIKPIKVVSSRGVFEYDESNYDFRFLDLEEPREILGGKPYKKLFNTTTLFSHAIPKSMKMPSNMVTEG